MTKNLPRKTSTKNNPAEISKWIVQMGRRKMEKADLTQVIAKFFQ
jgi:hypothetical protein